MVVTGAASGIGRAVAARMATNGWLVIALDRDPEGLEGLRADVEAVSGPESLRTVIADLAEPREAADRIVKAVEDLPRIDGLANIAGTYEPVEPNMADTAAFERILQVNLTAPWCLAATLWSKLADGGRIVNSGSLSSGAPFPKSIGYGSSKAGLNGLSRSLGFAGREVGITVRCINFGWVDTPMLDERRTTDPKRLTVQDAATEVIRILEGGASPRGADVYPFGSGGL